MMETNTSLLKWLTKMSLAGLGIMLIVCGLVISLSGCMEVEENGWVYFTTLPNQDKVYYKRFPEKKVTVYWTVRSVSVVKDDEK